MIESMTGYGGASQVFCTENGSFLSFFCECRSVNSRFFDLSVILPEKYRSVELDLRNLAYQYLKRGKIELKIQYEIEKSKDRNQIPIINLDELKNLLEMEKIVMQHAPQAKNLLTIDILNWPGIFEKTKNKNKNWKKHIIDVAKLALEDIKKSRQIEGKSLSQIIKIKTNAIRKIISSLEELLPIIISEHQKKLHQRLLHNFREYSNHIQIIDKEEIMNRIRQELIYNLKIDVTEELDRIHTHLLSIDQILEKERMVGKKLDFITQELNREINTINSKSISKKLNQISIEIRVLVEQIKEQAQNLE